MTVLATAAAAARRQWVLDRMTESLVGWGCPLDYAPARAAELLGHATAAGYALPAALQPPPEQPRADPAAAARHLAAIRAHLTDRRRHREGTPLPAGQDQQGSGMVQDPPGAPSASHGEV